MNKNGNEKAGKNGNKKEDNKDVKKEGKKDDGVKKNEGDKKCTGMFCGLGDAIKKGANSVGNAMNKNGNEKADNKDNKKADNKDVKKEGKKDDGAKKNDGDKKCTGMLCGLGD